MKKAPRGPQRHRRAHCSILAAVGSSEVEYAGPSAQLRRSWSVHRRANGPWTRRTHAMAVAELDTRILRPLLERPRTSVREDARILGVGRGPLQARLDRLERDGVITGTGPSLSPGALGHPVLAFVHIEVTQGRLDAVGDALAAVPEIVEAFSIAGGGDLLTRVVARDNAHLEDVIQKVISLPGVVRTRTEVALRERVAYRLLPLVESVGRAARS